MNDPISSMESAFSKAETPTIFARWTAITGVGAVLGRRVYMDRQIYTLFPNLYTVIVGPPAARKNAPPSKLRGILGRLDPPLCVVSSKSSLQAFFEEMIQSGQRDLTDIPVGEGMTEGAPCEAIGVWGELTEMINQDALSEGFGTHLCTLYDGEDTKYHTIGRGMRSLHRPCFSLLGAATPSRVKEAFPPQIIGGGLSSRMIFVFSGGPSHPVAWPKGATEELEEAEEGFQRINRLRGEAKPTDEAAQAFEDHYAWAFYHHRHKAIEGLSSYAARRGDHLLKLSMIFAAARRNSLQVEKEDVEAAKQELMTVEPGMERVVELVTATQVGNAVEKIKNYIRERGKVSRSELTSRMKNSFTAEQTRSLVNTLIQSGEVSEHRGNGVVYKWESD